jgi:hypothetical protein
VYERILVALDGSELSEQVLPHVEGLAAKLASTLVLVRVNPSLSASSAPGGSCQQVRADHEPAEVGGNMLGHEGRIKLIPQPRAPGRNSSDLAVSAGPVCDARMRPTRL